MNNDDAPSAAGTPVRLREVRRALLRLHKALLDVEREAYERSRGRISGSGEFLQLVISDPWFSWLRPVSGLIVRMDELAEDGQGEAEAAEAVAQARLLLRRPEEGGGEFGRRYYEALHQSPAVLLTHAGLKKILGAGQPPRVMREEEIDENLSESFPASDPPSWTLGTNHEEGEGGSR